MKTRALSGLLILLALILSGCGTLPTDPTAGSGQSSAGAPANTTNQNTTGPHRFGVQTKTRGCVAANALQDSACTPGAIITSATKAQICTSGYAKSVRNVPTSEKDQVYAEYGITHHSAGEYEVDHLVSLELGGSNDIANLWPEAASPKPGFHEKDQVENYMHDQVCSGAISLQQAQIQIATNWLTLYHRMGNRSSTQNLQEGAL